MFSLTPQRDIVYTKPPQKVSFENTLGLPFQLQSVQILLHIVWLALFESACGTCHIVYTTVYPVVLAHFCAAVAMHVTACDVSVICKAQMVSSCSTSHPEHGSM